MTLMSGCKNVTWTVCSRYTDLRFSYSRTWQDSSFYVEYTHGFVSIWQMCPRCTVSAQSARLYRQLERWRICFTKSNLRLLHNCLEIKKITRFPCSHCLWGFWIFAQWFHFTLPASPLTCTVAKSDSQTSLCRPSTVFPQQQPMQQWRALKAASPTWKLRQSKTCQYREEPEQQEDGCLSGSFGPQARLAWPGCGRPGEDIRVFLRRRQVRGCYCSPLSSVIFVLCIFHITEAAGGFCFINKSTYLERYTCMYFNFFLSAIIIFPHLKAQYVGSIGMKWNTKYKCVFFLS